MPGIAFGAASYIRARGRSQPRHGPFFSNLLAGLLFREGSGTLPFLRSLAFVSSQQNPTIPKKTSGRLRRESPPKILR
jgi:hypothetical protein